MSADLDDQQLTRYARQIVLRDIDLAGQQRLLDGRVLIVGMGGLGSPAALYLAGAGVGHLVLADHDVVDLSNLHRQVIHRNADVGRSKAQSARDAVLALNPELDVSAVHARMTPDTLVAQVAAVDVVLDCTDNFEARFAINAACVAARRPLVSGAAIRLEGQVAVFRADLPDAPCYRCLYREQAGQAEHCSQVGVLGPVVGVIGAMQALETIKLLAGFGETLTGRLLLFDARSAQWREVRLRRDPDCPTCGRRPAG